MRRLLWFVLSVLLAVPVIAQDDDPRSQYISPAQTDSQYIFHRKKKITRPKKPETKRKKLSKKPGKRRPKGYWKGKKKAEPSADGEDAEEMTPPAGEGGGSPDAPPAGIDGAGSEEEDEEGAAANGGVKLGGGTPMLRDDAPGSGGPMGGSGAPVGGPSFGGGAPQGGPP